MTALILFLSGMTIGVIFEKSIFSWKEKLSKAAKAAKSSLDS